MKVRQELKDKYIDPFTDFGFKKLFGEENNKDLLLSFLNELLHKEEGKSLKRLDNIPDRLRDRIFERMFASAEIAKLTKEEYRDYIDSLNSYRDLKNSLDYAKEEGKTEEKIKTAIRLLGKGMSVEDVSDATELPVEQIEQLTKETGNY